MPAESASSARVDSPGTAHDNPRFRRPLAAGPGGPRSLAARGPDMLAMALQSAPPEAPSLLASLFPILVLLFISWLLLFRPMMREKKAKESMRTSLKAGDRVITIGGIHGAVTRLSDRTVHVRVADGVQVEFSTSAIAAVVPPEERQ